MQNRAADLARAYPSNGILPVAISYSTAPNENRSVRASRSLARTCSGDMYATVPSMAPGLVRCAASDDRQSVSVLPLRAADFGRHLRQAEVENLGVPALRDEDVGRLDVAMNDALRVCGVQRVGNLDGEVEKQSRSPAAAGDAGASASGRRGTP